MEITPCSLNDLTDLCQISVETFTESFKHLNDPADFEQFISTAYTPARLTAELENPNSHFFLMKSETDVLGYLKINFAPAQSDHNDPESLEVERIYLLQKAQKQQLGQKMMQFAIEMARQQQKKYIWLGVWEKNEKAINFYKKHGFEVFDQHIFVIGNDPQTDFLMKLKL
ncbi:MAG: hypothetical protein RL757_1798 [Bacteroidota bacterium]|jgi:ribosomal protein S18 acetylase RimI-like enzyme